MNDFKLVKRWQLLLHLIVLLWLVIPPAPVRAEQSFRLMFTGNVFGELEPCGG